MTGLWPPAPRPLGSQLDLVGLGEPLVLLQAPEGESLTEADALDVHVAGAELNACAAVARLGGQVTLYTRLGADPFGTRVRTAAAALGVGMLAEVDPDRPTGLFVKDVRPDGRRRVHYYRSTSAASRISAADVARIWSLQPRAVLVSGLTAALGDLPRQAVEAAAAAHEHGVALIVDVNLRPQLGRTDDAVRALRSLLPSTDLLFVGTDESLDLLGSTDPAEVARAARAAGCREVVVKAGADGCWWIDDTGAMHHQPAVATQVVDPVGAGDAFAGGYIAARLSGASTAAAAWLGTALAAEVVASVGDTNGLPEPRTARNLLQQAREGVVHAGS